MSLLACPGFQYLWVGLMLQYLTANKTFERANGNF